MFCSLGFTVLVRFFGPLYILTCRSRVVVAYLATAHVAEAYIFSLRKIQLSYEYSFCVGYVHVLTSNRPEGPSTQ